MDRQSARSFSRVATIAPQHAFLDTLIEALFDGDLLPGFVLNAQTLADNPFYLADLTLFLPTRRAVRAAEDVIVSAIARRSRGEAAALLPQIRAIGDTDEADLILQESAIDPLTTLSDLPPSMAELERHVALTEMVWSWSRALVKQVANMEPYEAVIIPANPADAARLASDLAGLLDEAENQKIDWTTLKTLVPDDFARYWQLSLSFLEIVTRAWPQHLAGLGRIDAMARRNRLIDMKAKALIEHAATTGPTIAAGSTGSVPATARLLKAIAGLPNGCVVLPGVDLALEDNAWAAIAMQTGEGETVDPAALGHPQAALKQTMRQLGVTRADIREIQPKAGAGYDTTFRLINEALRPAAVTDQWPRIVSGFSPQERREAFANVTLINARNSQEEAVSIALSIREALETDNLKTAALVTPDRSLARRVSVELERFGISADDSAGQPLFATPAGTLARLVIEAASGGTAITILAMLKHPLCGLGLPRVTIREGVRALERAVLRGPALAAGSENLSVAIATIRQRMRADPKLRLNASQKSMNTDEWDEATRIAEVTQNALHGFETWFADPQAHYPLGELVNAHLHALQNVLAGEDTAALFANSEDGTALIAAMTELRDLGPDARQLDIRASDYPDLLQALLGARPVRRQHAVQETDSRVQILGTLEARLLHADHLVLGGLNENTWPADGKTDPWLSRQMRMQLGLNPPEQAIGLSAHDFVQLASKPNVVLTRSLLQDGAPTQASRWLQRLAAMIGETGHDALALRGHRLLALARRLDAPADATGIPVPRPSPKPAPDLRPKRLSVTEIETLIRDPYAIYARHVLKLLPFDHIGEAPDFASRGSLLHDILQEFLEARQTDFDTPAAAAELKQIAQTHFQSIRAYPELYARWHTRFQRISDWFLGFEAQRSGAVRQRLTELSGSLELGVPEFLLTGRADRIDLLNNGLVEIIDYKTGQVPTKSQVETYLAPQLPLEAAIVAAGGFAGIPAVPSQTLAYVRLSGNRIPGAYTPVSDGESEVTDLAAGTLARLRELIAHFADAETGYLSQAQPQTMRYEGAYDHLARVAEWRAMGQGEEAEE
uniref:double-strand break repair protein AddB n=1 Tax=Pararhizobium sp. IMCC3301 TaxID=3067904 RepID=UPI0027424AF5|nr:double-strand break repair protein AddB [Pararhizobium sp. IMCC3301]